MLLKEMVDDVTARLGSVISNKEFAGELIEIGDVKIVPMLRLQLGFGGGGGEGDASVSVPKKEGAAGGDGAGLATAGAVTVRPVGVIVFTKKGVRVLQVKEKRPTIERVLDTIPETVERVRGVVRRLDTEDGVLGASSTEEPPPPEDPAPKKK
jgi:uncharacterized spore protein YtfJ